LGGLANVCFGYLLVSGKAQTNLPEKMKLRILFILIFIIQISFGQNSGFKQIYVYEGQITEKGQKLEIYFNFLIQSDSTIVGVNSYKEPKWITNNLKGKLLNDNTFSITEIDKSNIKVDSIIGRFDNNFNTIRARFIGKEIDFELNQKKQINWYDYITKNRSLFEYKNFKNAVRERKKVLSIDVANKEFKRIPAKLSRLDKIVSFNLLGNRIEKFPKVLSKLETLDEISLSSNRLKYVGSEIGKLKNLRILILNFNQLTELPKEIGKLENLMYLEIGNNKLTTLPEEIKYLTNLQELHIERNNISETEKERIKKLLPKCKIHF
jgi:Leucine-rich repeat (LRR) protein